MQTIHGAGHYVYADQPEDFNHSILQVCDKVDWSREESGYWALEKTGSTIADITTAAGVETQDLSWQQGQALFEHVFQKSV